MLEMMPIFIMCVIILIYYLCKKSKLIKKEKLTNISSPSFPVVAIFQRYSKYDPYYFPYPMDQCYLGTHSDGSLIRARGCEKFGSNKFLLVPADRQHYYIKSIVLNSYLYLTKNNIPLTKTIETNEQLTDKFKWKLSVNPSGYITIRNPHTERYLALSCANENVYSRVNYTDDCLFKVMINYK
jgi:hypothetical protein